MEEIEDAEETEINVVRPLNLLHSSLASA